MTTRTIDGHEFTLAGPGYEATVDGRVVEVFPHVERAYNGDWFQNGWEVTYDAEGPIRRFDRIADIRIETLDGPDAGA